MEKVEGWKGGLIQVLLFMAIQNKQTTKILGGHNTKTRVKSPDYGHDLNIYEGDLH